MEGFARAIEKAKTEFYLRTNKLMPNWMVVSPEMMTILVFTPGFNAANAGIANGPYKAGTIGNMNVFVSPALAGEKVCYLGVLGSDGVSGTGLYCPLINYAMA